MFMGKIVKNLLILFLILALNSQFFIGLSNASDPNSYTTFRTVDKNSFNEYRYLITKEFFTVRSVWEIDGILDPVSLTRLRDLVNRGFNYLPDNNLENENLLNNVNTSISKSLKYNRSDAAYSGLINALWSYLDKSSITAISWNVLALPAEGNAPFNVTLRTNVVDPTWTTIPQYNYTWWMDLGSRKINIGTGPSINYTFKEEWNFTVFVSVSSSHKNSKWYTDVIPFEDSVTIKVKEKVASLILKVNANNLGTNEILKFTPSQAKYGLLFDATSSIPTGSAKFIRTEWDFGNWIKREYNWEPKIERIVYSDQDDYSISLVLKTNLGKTIRKEFTISIRDPIATINVNPSEWFLGDKFTISAKNLTTDNNLTYNWTITDIVEEKVIFSKQTKLFTYNFPNKGHFNVKLEVSGADSGNRNVDTTNIYINSRAPVAEFRDSIPELNKPNRILLNATDSFDADFTDTGKLKYSWEIDWSRVVLEEANEFGSLGYYTFDTIWDHNVVLKVEDPDNIEWIKKGKVNVKSVLSVDFSANNRAIKRWESITFDAVSPNASFFEWDFGDWAKSTGWIEERITHKYEKTGIFTVKLKVLDEKGNSTIQTKVVYIWNWTHPVAILDIWNTSNSVSMSKNACNWNDAFIVDRITSVLFDLSESIDIDGNTYWIDYSLKVWNNKYYTTSSVSHKFDELGCYPVILKVTSKENHNSDSAKIWIKVENIKPTLSNLAVKVESLETDPVIVNVNAVWATDRDGVITSYLWYYYTDLDDEPQDFRSTIGPSTKFVLPKITWNYYFVVLLADDSEDRISSEEIWKRANLTLAWDNINVPIVELKTPDNNVAVFDEVIFNSKVQNILKQDLSKKVAFFWDFDGDWFYDLETKTSSVTYSYSKPGTYYAKLKVKYKGFTNTRNIEINVVNSLIPKFDYISVWNKFIFINKTTGVYENISFDLWNEIKIDNEDYFEHTYSDWKSSHIVKLTASDWNTVKNVETKVVKNLNNLLKSKSSKNWILISIPESDSKNEIIIKKRTENISIYFSWDRKNFSEIWADSNLNKDTDLNWWKDDDNDISSSNNSYLNIELDRNKTQLIRVFVKDEDGVVMVSKDYKIIKEYIKDEEINLDNVIFEGVTDLQKQQLEELKDLVSWVTWDDSRIAKVYIARLKDEWGDENERIKIIYEFDWYLNDSLIQNKDEIIEKLQELLLKENDESNEKNIALRALQWLTSWNIVCEYDDKEYTSCKNYIDSTLQTIRNNDDLEQNKLLWTTILNIIWTDTNLSTSQKLDYKATLQSLIYGSVENIPEEIVDDIIDDNDGVSTVSSILSTIWYILLFIMLLFGLLFAWYYVYYKVLNKNSDQNFEDFIADKTDSKDDVFSEKKEEITKEVKTEDKIESKNDIFSETKITNSNSTNSASSEKKKMSTDLWNKKVEKDAEKEKVKSEDVPDWLKWSFDTDVKVEEKPKEIKKEIVEEKKKEKPVFEKEKPVLEKEKKEVVKEESFKKDIKKSEIKKPEIKKEVVKEIKKEETLDEITKVEDDNIPDWLKVSLEESPKKDTKKSETKNEIESNTVSKTTADDNIPDWLKGSLDEGSKKQESKKDKSKEEIVENKVEKETEKKEEKIVIVKKDKKDTKIEEKKTVNKKETVKKTPEKVEQKIEDKKVEINKEESKKENPKKEEKIATVKEGKTVENKDSSKKESGSDLWDDWMDIPDWLKS